MKFFLAIFAVVVCAHAHETALPLAYSYAPAPLIAARPIDGTYTERQFAPRLVAPITYSAPLHYQYAAPYASPYAYAAPIHAPLTYAAPLAYAAPIVAATKLAPTYTAANRGALHVAPLPGHSESTSSVNLEAAPGTF